MKQTINTSVAIVVLLLISAHTVYSQAPAKEVRTKDQAWLGYFNQTRFSKKWGLWMELQYRQTDHFVNRPFQFMFRPALTYYIKDNVRINAGYALIEHFPAKGLNTTRLEHRPWQQIWWNQKYNGFSTLQWLRLEERFNQKVVNDVKQNGYNFNYRLRYNFAFFVPLKGKEMLPKTPFAVLINEVFINFGKKVTYNTFDQNRLFAGIGYQFTPEVNAQFGYMNVYQQEAVGNKYTTTNVIRLSLFHSLDYRKKG